MTRSNKIADKTVKTPLTYRDAGVDIDAGNALVRAIAPLAKATARPGADGALGGFGGLFDLKAAGFHDPILVAANDGVGTKVKIAIETGMHDTIGIDLVAMCVNDLIVQGAEPLFFLDYFATGQLEQDVARQVIAGISEGCLQAGAALIGGETAEMPGLYAKGDYDLAGFCVGAAERGALLPRQTMQAGDSLIGLASSGAHSNGYSLIRKLIADNGIGWQDPAPFSPDETIAEALLRPTHIYVKPLLSLLGATDGLKALAHITGGGLTENMPRVLPQTLMAQFDLRHLTLPPLFSWLAKISAIGQDEMFRTFNCGIGMVLVAAAADTDPILDALKASGETAFIVGELTTREGDAAVEIVA